MFRFAVLLCAVTLLQAAAVRTLRDQSSCRSALPDADSDGGCSPTVASADGSDDALLARGVVIAPPAAPRLHRWNGPALAVAPSPAPDEILHVPKPLSA